MSFQRVAVFSLLGWFILILQSTVISYTTYGILQPELLLVILVHTGVYRRGAEGTILAMGYGYLMDIFSGRPFGTYLFLYVSLFFVARVLSVRLLLQARFVQMTLIFLFSLTSEITLFALARMVPLPEGSGLAWSGIALRAIANTAGVLIMFPVLGRLEHLLGSRSRTLQYG